MSPSLQPIYLAGAGPAGAALAAYLGIRGFPVTVVEQHADPRLGEPDGQRTINIAYMRRTERVAEQLGILDELLRVSTPMPRRVYHDAPTGLRTQDYGPTPEHALMAVSRWDVNRLLVEAADRHDSVRFIFDSEITAVDCPNGHLTYRNDAGTTNLEDGIVFGCDGLNSVVARALVKQCGVERNVERFPISYMELGFPAGPGGTYQMEENAFHIWPRSDDEGRSFMLIAIPNKDGSFNGILFLSAEGEVSFQTLHRGGRDAVQTFFEEQFPDAVALVPDYSEQFAARRSYPLRYVTSSPWYGAGRVFAIGDATGAILPFMGQGMSAGLETVRLMVEALAAGDFDFAGVLPAFLDQRRVDVDAIRVLAEEHYTDMSKSPNDPVYPLMRVLGNRLAARYPARFRTSYMIATFSHDPYREALAASRLQAEVLRSICTPYAPDEPPDDDEATRIVDRIDLDAAIAIYEAAAA